MCCAKDESFNPSEPQNTNEVETAVRKDQVDKYMFVEGMEDAVMQEESPVLMDRSHVQYVPPRSLSLSRRPDWPPPLPTHPPAHTNQPWWTTTTTTTTTPKPWSTTQSYWDKTTWSTWVSPTTTARPTTSIPWWMSTTPSWQTRECPCFDANTQIKHHTMLVILHSRV